jgi:excisionase family DNA binding protein
MNKEDKHASTNKNSTPGTFVEGGKVVAWTVSDVARELQVSVRHIYQLMSEDKIPYSKVGRLIRFSPARIQEWLEKSGTR